MPGTATPALRTHDLGHGADPLDHRVVVPARRARGGVAASPRTGAPPQVERTARVVAGAILAQGALGYAQYFSGVPPYMVIFHVLGSVLVFVASLTLYLSLFTAPTTATRRTGPA